MPGMDGLAATAELAATTDARIIILTTFDLDEYVVAAIKAGASGFLLKDAPPEELLGAIRRVARRGRRSRAVGDAPPDGTPAPRAFRSRRTAPASRSSPTASARCSILMAHGRSNQEICGELFLAEPTVKAHVGRVLAKLGARDRVQAVVIAYETGLVRPGG